jgi:UDP-N-acetylmuramoyl-tripeptide--D-alanyl-D-alanine ligase
VGAFNFDNALAAVAIGKYFGINAQYISEALEEYVPRNNRSQFERTQKNDLIIDAYNANPTSMKAALDFFVNIPSALPKAVIVGEMKELGNISKEEHADLLRFISEQPFAKVYLVGEVFNESDPSYTVFNTVEELIAELKKHPLENHYVLLKGSHAIHLEKAIPYL